MICYTLKCADGHSFDSWFKSAEAFEALDGRGMLSCSVCGGSDVKKAMMAPRVSKSAPMAEAKGGAEPPKLSQPDTPMEQALTALRKHIEANSTYVGGNFAAEARRIHLGDALDRLIHGEAKPEEARALIEDGIPVAPLPIFPKNRST